MQAMAPPKRFAVQLAAVCSAGAGLVHATAVGTHTEETTLVWMFAICAVAQVGLAGLALLRPTRMVLAVLGAVNLGAFLFWGLSRTVGLPTPAALQEVESIGTADLIAAFFAVVGAGAAAAVVFRPASKRVLGPAWTFIAVIGALGLTVPALAAGTSHSHDHGEAGHSHTMTMADGTVMEMDGHEHSHDKANGKGKGHDHADGHEHDTEVDGTTVSHGHDGSDPSHAHGATDPTHPHSSTDPTHPHDPNVPHDPTHPHDPAVPHDPNVPHDPTVPHDPGHQHPPVDPTDPDPPPHHHPPDGPIISIDDPRLTAAQRAAAQRLMDRTRVGMTGLTSVAAVEAAGYRSIGDSGTGYEHFVNWTFYNDGVEMDRDRIESVVFQVAPDGTRTMVSAMYILRSGKTMADAPDIAGELTMWHDHQNLCWDTSGGNPRVVGTTGPDGRCARGVFIATPPMLHVWMVPNECGPFAGIEGSHGATPGCGHTHSTPTGPVISLDDPRVTPAQRAAAQQLIDATVAGMRRFTDVASVEAAGYRSIGDAGTGWEHFINSAYLNSSQVLDPDTVESVVFKVEPDGTRTLASAMYILPLGTTMADVPEIAGELTTWHDHQNLCWSVSGGLRVVGVTDANGRCARGVFIATPPMLHVWLIPNECGPFAGIDGSHGSGCVGHEH
jgi:hypothetical protein